MTKDELDLLCEELSTAQRIRYYSRSHESESIKLFITSSRGNPVLMSLCTYKYDDVFAHRCGNSKKKFLLKNNMYEGLLIFVNKYAPDKDVPVSIEGMITNHLSYEDAGSYAISIFQNLGIPIVVKEQKYIRVCASLFQGLSSDLVQSRATYYLMLTTRIIEGKFRLFCEGAEGLYQIFITYNVILAKWNYRNTITVTHVKENGEIIETDTIF